MCDANWKEGRFPQEINTLIETFSLRHFRSTSRYPNYNIQNLYMEAQNLIKDCLEKVCAANPDDKQKHLIYRKLGIKYQVEKLPHTLITIQFDEIKLDDREKEEIGDLHSLLSNYKWFKNNIYHLSYEYFSKEYPDGGNLHMHILVKQEATQLNKTKIIRDISSKYKDILKVVDYKHSTSKEHYNNRYAYVTGAKQDAGKLVFHERDCVWRVKNKIDPYYTNAS